MKGAEVTVRAEGGAVVASTSTEGLAPLDHDAGHGAQARRAASR
jgi:hypothetical protein